MMDSQTSIYSNRKFSYQLLDQLSIQIEVLENPFVLDPEDLFVMAARRNKKRAFLFVSTILGKHLPVTPAKALATGSLLAGQYAFQTAGMQVLNECNLSGNFKEGTPLVPKAFIPPELSPVIIGFAETATALGQSFFACFKKADFFHTTRETIADEEPLIVFEEEHSHATSHRCYIKKELLDNNREIVLVDDEMSTGKTAINIIRSIQAQFPRESYSVVSILDWRSDQDAEKFNELQAELGITIKCVSLIRGKFTVTGQSDVNDTNSASIEKGLPEPAMTKIFLDSFQTKSMYLGGRLGDVPYDSYSGRFAMSEFDQRKLDNQIKEMAEKITKHKSGKRILCVGTGEFMYIPMRIAALMGSDVSYQSTTRSPIHIIDKEGYGARHRMAFPNPEDPEVQHYLYNVAPELYDEVFVFFEREVPDKWLRPMLAEFGEKAIPSVKVVFFQKKAGDK